MLKMNRQAIKVATSADKIPGSFATYPHITPIVILMLKVDCALTKKKKNTN